MIIINLKKRAIMVCSKKKADKFLKYEVLMACRVHRIMYSDISNLERQLATTCKTSG
jgi:hypothetical protein